MQLLELFHELSVRPQNAKELKGLILQLAVQGKLTANWRQANPTIEPASELLKRIQTEKEQLMKAKKIKKEKPLPEISEDERPFDLPDSWQWARLRDVGTTMTGGTPSKNNPEYFGNDIPFLKPGDIVDWVVDYSNEGLSIEGEKKLNRTASEGSILMVCVGTIGKCAKIDRSCAFNQQINSISPILVNSNYLLISLSSKYFNDLAWERSTSTTISLLNKGNWESIAMPFPPLEEQKAIVEIVESLFKEVEQLEALTEERVQLKEDFTTSALRQLTEGNTSQEWQQLKPQFANFFDNEANIKKLRESILQLAVQGKLTANWREENPAIEPASELLKRIQAEKEQLIKEKKIKKEKPLPPISDEEVPYELPEGWEWCKVRDLAVGFQNGISKRGGDGSPLTVLRLADIKNGRIDLNDTRDINLTEKEKEKYNLEPDDILITRVNGSADIVGTFTTVEVSGDLSYCDHFIRLRFFIKDSTSTEYIALVSGSELIRSRIKDLFVSTAGQKTVNQGHISSLLFPLPSIEEQKVIVEKVNQLMAYCDELEEQVKQSQTHTEQLMQSVLREVFEG